MQVANIGAEPQPHTGTNGNQNDVAGSQRRHAEPTDEISRAVDAGEALIDRLGGGQVIDEDHGARAIAAPVEPDRWPLPEHPQIASIACVERALAVAQARDERAAGLLTQDVAVGLAPLA